MPTVQSGQTCDWSSSCGPSQSLKSRSKSSLKHSKSASVSQVFELTHQLRVRNSVLHVTRPAMVQNNRLLLSWDLNAAQVLLIATIVVSILVTVHDHVLVSLQEVQLESLSVNHGWSQVQVVRVKASTSVIPVSGSDLEVNAFKVCLLASWLHLRARASVLCSALVAQHRDHFVKTRWVSFQVDMSGVELLTCGHFVKLVLDKGEHLANSDENALSEFVLIVDCQPA